MTATIAFSSTTRDLLVQAAQRTNESAWFGRGGCWTNDHETSAAVWTLDETRPHHYVDAQPNGLILTSEAWVPHLHAARTNGQAVIYAHTHPAGHARFSSADDRVEQSMVTALQSMTTGIDVPLVSVVINKRGSFAARIWMPGADHPLDTTRIRVVGNRLDLRHDDTATELAHFDRQVRAFGHDGQRLLRRTRIGLVGVGGTGSAVFEQLVRLGVTPTVVIDPDELSNTSVTRGFGSGLNQVGMAKVGVARELADRVGFQPVGETLVGTVCDEEAARRLAHCDIVFACTDDHAGRLILNRLAYHCVVPVIDIGVLMSSSEDILHSIDGRVTWVAPGSACLLCRDRIDPEIAAAEQLDTQTRQARAAEGYAPELGQPDPSVIAYTAGIASFAVAEMLHRLLGVGDATSSELLWAPLTQRLSTNNRPARPECYCTKPPTAGDASFLGITWAA